MQRQIMRHHRQRASGVGGRENGRAPASRGKVAVMANPTISELLARAEAAHASGQIEIARCRELCARSRALVERLRADSDEVSKTESDSHKRLAQSFRRPRS